VLATAAKQSFARRRSQTEFGNEDGDLLLAAKVEPIACAADP
jgi:hypothetical protein